MRIEQGPLFEELHREAEAQACRVHLEHAGAGDDARLSRIAVIDRDGTELAGLERPVERLDEREHRAAEPGPIGADELRSLLGLEPSGPPCARLSVKFLPFAPRDFRSSDVGRRGAEHDRLVLRLVPRDPLVGVLRERPSSAH